MDAADRILDAVVRLERKVDRLARLQASPVRDPMLTAGQVDRLYRLRKGTAAAHCRTGALSHTTRKGRRSETFLIDPKDAARAFGGG